MISSSTDRPDARESILAAAEVHFREHGYRRTNVADIANDAGMSPANLYRYFENKQQIGAACCERWMGSRVEALRLIARQKGLSASARLQEFLLKNLQYTHELAANHPHIQEMVDVSMADNPTLVHHKIDQMVALIAEILAYGNESGEFEVSDVVTTARSVHCSQVVFEVPLFMHLYPYEFFEATIRDLTELLIKGLARRSD